MRRIRTLRTVIFVAVILIPAFGLSQPAAKPPASAQPEPPTEPPIPTQKPTKERKTKDEDEDQTLALFDAVNAVQKPIGPPPIIDLLDVKDADLVDVLRFLCEKGGAQLVVDPSVGQLKVTCRLENVSWLQAVHIITKNAGLACEFEAGVLKTGN